MFDHPYIFTFYSYKGGVGRSLALLNMAYALAGRGRHVLVVEMDIEAPGISGFLQRQKELAPPEAAHPKDILSLLSLAFGEVRGSWDQDTLAMKPGWDAQAAAQNLPPVSAFIRSVADDKLAPLRPRVGQLGRLDVIVADLERDYWCRLAELAIQGTPQPQLIEVSKLLHFYFRAQRFPHRPFGLEPFESPVQTPYDYVLVDSRTGITEVGGLCVGPLADRLVLFTSLNDQNVQGTLAFMKEAGIEPKPRPADQERWDDADPGAADESAKPALGPKPTLLVASPVPSGEIRYKRYRFNELRKSLGLSPAKLSYHPQMALIESIFVRDYADEYLAMEYGALADAIMAQIQDDFQHLARRSLTLWNERRAPDAVGCVLRLTPHRPEVGIPLLSQLVALFKPATDPEFFVERQLHAFMSGLQGDTKHEALNNWGAALSAQAKTKTGEAADRLFEAAGQKYAEALRIKPDT
ncbi:MAG: ParA family protein, partial [Planctomycetes bacterium]|nr:ParA family protein [Planctomycetota bacterium]